MIPIRLIQDTELHKVGEIINCSKKDAESYVKNGFAEYVEVPKRKTRSDKGKKLTTPEKEMIKLEKEYNQFKKAEIFVNISARNLKELKEKYKAVNIDDLIEKRVKYYRAKPFEGRSKLVWIEKIKEWLELVNEDAPEEPEQPKKENNKQQNEIIGTSVFSRRGQIESFWNEQPFFYDKSKIFWLWNKAETKWEISDEVEFLNSIQETLGVETIDSKARNELEAGFKQIGRKHTPKATKSSWIQFKDKIYDIKTGEVFTATPEYFVKNPIPWKVGEDNETPTIDKLFQEWVGEDYVPTLYQICAYAISPHRFMQRIIGLVGGGLNGKTTFVKLLKKFIGAENSVASELRLLGENQFETAVIYGKLLVVFGEVSYDDLRNTNTLKQIAGEDDLRFCFKGKTPFTAQNTALGICLTNSLPTTPDKSLGFYRKWMIIDFPNQFKELKKDLIAEIPDVEFENLANKSLWILKNMYEYPVFTNEGDFETRIIRYEERSNPVMKFLEEQYCEEAGQFTPLREFTSDCNEWLNSRHLRVLSATQVGKILRKEGFLVGNRKIDDISQVVILNLKSEVKQ